MYRRAGKTRRRGCLCEFQGSRLRLKRSPASSSFPFLRSLRGPGIAVSKAAARMSKTKVSFFSLEGPGYRRATTIHFLLFPFSSSRYLSRHRLPLSLSVLFSLHFLAWHSSYPQLFFMFDVLPLAPPTTILFPSLYRLLSQRTRACSFRAGSFLPSETQTIPRGRRRKSKEDFSRTRQRTFNAETNETRPRELQRRLVSLGTGNDCAEKLKIPRLP